MNTINQAEATVYTVAEFHGIDTEQISDTGTIEAMIDAGVPEDRIATGLVSHDEVLENLVWLD